MDFELTEAQQDLAGLTRRIVTDRADPGALGMHGTGGLDRQLWKELARAGIVDAALPSEVGGGGFGLLEQCSVLIELGRATANVPYLHTVTMAGAALAESGTVAQRERWLVPAVRGERLLSVALPDAADPCGFTARQDGQRWLLTGEQTAVAAAACADVVLLAADTPEGTAVFVVDASDPGLTVRAQRTVDRADAALIEATELPLESAALLGTPGSGIAERIRLCGTVGLCAQQLGVLQRALELTAEHARQRVQFDNVIGSFQAVRQRLADAYVDVDAVRLTLWQAAWRLSEELEAAAEVATAKYWAAEAGHRVAHTAVHIHGGVGLDTDHSLHRYFVAAKRLEFTLGGATAQLRSLGDALSA